MVKVRNCLFVCLLCIVFLSACNFLPASVKPSTVLPAKVQAPEGTVALYDGTEYNFSLLSCGSASSAYEAAVDDLYDGIAELVGSTKLVAYNDEGVIPPTAQPNEIMVGEVNRVKAQDALAEIEESFCYLIEVSETSVVIAGSTEKYVLQAVEYFTETYLKENTVLKDGAVYIKTGKFVSESVTPTIGEYVQFQTNRQQPVKYTLEKAFTYAPADLIKTNHVLQGSCLSADGKYMFIALDKGGEAYSSFLAKYDMATGKTVKTNTSPNCDHANDMCYLPKDEAIAVVHNAPNPDLISIYKASDLSFVKTVKLSVKIHSLSYDAENDRFVAGISGSKDDFAILDSDFKVVKKFTNSSAGGTHQGGDCDSEYIYFVQSAQSEKETNILVIYDWDGNKIAVVPLPEVSYEIECMTHVGTDFYVSYYRGYSLKGGEFHKISLAL